MLDHNAAFKEQFKMQVITVTMSPVFDRTLWVRNFEVGKTFLAERSETYAGGKGVNVSRALLSFSFRSTATGLLGNKGSEAYIELLDADGIEHDFFVTGGVVRTNITVVSPESGKETHLREIGTSFPEAVLTDFIEKLRELRQKFTINNIAAGSQKSAVSSSNVLFVFAGGLPAGLSKHTYRKLVRTVSSWKCASVLDTSGQAFKEGVSASPLFIKPNIHEVEAALGFLPSSRMEFIKAVETFHNLGIERVMISRGEDGMVYSRGMGILEAKLEIRHPLNTVGSGDCAVAGGVIGIIRNLNDDETIRLACAMGGANTLVSGAGRFSRDDVHELMHRVRIKRL